MVFLVPSKGVAMSDHQLSEMWNAAVERQNRERRGGSPKTAGADRIRCPNRSGIVAIIGWLFCERDGLSTLAKPKI